MQRLPMIRLGLILTLLLTLTVGPSWAQGPAIDSSPEQVSGMVAAPMVLDNAIGYQGQLQLNGSPVNDHCDFQFGLWNAETGGSQIGFTQTITNVWVHDGLFLADDLDFGSSAFNGDPRWLQHAVRCPTGVGGYSTLSPRSPIRPAPHALYSGDADKLDGVHASGFLSSSGGTVSGDIGFYAGVGLHEWEIGVEGSAFPPPAYGWFYVKDLNDPVQPLRLLIDQDTGDVGVAKNLGVGTSSPAARLQVEGDSYFNGNVGIGISSPAKKLHVQGESQFDGISTFYIGGGSFAVTTPGGWPGLIALAPNGHRREMSFKDDRMQILVSSTGSSSPNDNGINIYESGTVGVKVLQITGGSDLAEPFDVLETKSAQPGMVMVIDAEHPGQLRLADQAYDRKVAGCVSGANDVQPGLIMSQEGSMADGAVPVALTGRAYCWADAAYGAIEPGDLLTTSARPGHAMKVTEFEKAQGAVIGKAMTALAEGQGVVLVLIALQ